MRKQTFRRDNNLKSIHARTPVPSSFSTKNELPHVTPIVGDAVVYETWAGDKIHHTDALRLMKQGREVFYTTWETPA
jgi:hypothetical protein